MKYNYTHRRKPGSLFRFQKTKRGILPWERVEAERGFDDPADISPLRLLSPIKIHGYKRRQRQGYQPACLKEANTDGDLSGLVDPCDLTKLIGYLFITFTPPAECR